MRNRSMSARYSARFASTKASRLALKLHDLVIIHSVHRRFSAHHGDARIRKASAVSGANPLPHIAYKPAP